MKKIGTKIISYSQQIFPKDTPPIKDKVINTKYSNPMTVGVEPTGNMWNYSQTCWNQHVLQKNKWGDCHWNLWKVKKYGMTCL